MFIRRLGCCLPVAALLLPTPAAAEDVALDKMLAELKKALVLVGQDHDVVGLPPLKTATLNVSTVQTKEVGGKLKLFIIEIGHKHTSALTTKVSVVLTPPKAASMPVAATLDVAKQLSNAILSAARAVASASGTQPPLVTKEIKATIKFGVKGDTSGGITFVLAPVEIGLSGDIATEATQEIEVVYGN